MFLPFHDKNPLKFIPFQRVTVSLMLLCLAVFIYQQGLADSAAAEFLFSFGMLPAVFFESRVLAPELLVVAVKFTLLSSIFLHDSWMHLFANMTFLWIFGDNVEDSMGHWRFLVFFLVCGACASLAHGLAETESVSPLIGASGAVSGVLAAYLLLLRG